MTWRECADPADAAILAALPKEEQASVNAALPLCPQPVDSLRALARAVERDRAPRLDDPVLLAVMGSRLGLPDVALQEDLAVDHAQLRHLSELRAAKQHRTFALALDLLRGAAGAVEVARALSEQAATLLRAATQIAWREFSRETTFGGTCPIGFACFGALAAGRMSFVAPVELSPVFPPQASAAARRAAERFLAEFRRAVVEPMEHGSLYALASPGGAIGGRLARRVSMEDLAAFVRGDAAFTDRLDLAGSVALVGPPGFARTWEDLRAEVAFRGAAFEPDLLRASAGAFGATFRQHDDAARLVAQIEVLVRLAQLVFGHIHEGLRGSDTRRTLGEIERLALLRPGLAWLLREGYERMLRLSLIQDLFGPRVATPDALARLVGYESWAEAERDVRVTDANVRVVADEVGLAPIAPPPDPWKRAGLVLGASPEAALALVESVGHARPSLCAISESPRVAERMGRASELAPALLRECDGSEAMLDALVTGDLRAPPDNLRAAWWLACARWVLGRSPETLGVALSALVDGVVARAYAGVGVPISIWAEGLYATRDLALGDAVEVLVVSPSRAGRLRERLHRVAELPFALRVRERTMEEALDLPRRYFDSRMRPVYRAQEAEPSKTPVSAGDIERLVAHKHAMQAERVSRLRLRRDLRFGLGGLDDLDWLVGLHFARHPQAAPVEPLFDDELRHLAEARLLNMAEVEVLRECREFLVTLRAWMSLAGIPDSTMPENPAKLERLARAMECDDANALLARHQDVAGTVASLFEQAVERLAR